jgi:hypothetical protein
LLRGCTTFDRVTNGSALPDRDGLLVSWIDPRLPVEVVIAR